MENGEPFYERSRKNDRCQSNQKMTVWGKITRLRENFQNSSIKVQWRTLIDVFLPKFHADLARYKVMRVHCRPLHVTKQEGQHPLTGQRAPPISGGT